MTVAVAQPAPGRTMSRTAAAVGVRYLLLVAVVVGVAAVHVRRPSTLCLLRATTGVPCPFCGGTTAAVHLGHGDVRGAIAASPLALLLVAAWPWLGVVRAPTWWWRAHVRWPVIAVVLVAAEVWQLLRFGLIGV